MQVTVSVYASYEFLARAEKTRKESEKELKLAAFVRKLLTEAVEAREASSAVIPPRPTKPVRSKGVEKWEWDLTMETYKKDDAEWVEKYGAKSVERVRWSKVKLGEKDIA